MTLAELLVKIHERINQKVQRAYRGYLNQNMVQVTSNCLHKGRTLSKEISVCKELALGDFEGDVRNGAHCCWDEKARICPLFSLKKNPQELKSDFNSMAMEEFLVRWPSIGELLRVEKWIREAPNVKEETSFFRRDVSVGDFFKEIFGKNII
jgi:hypothetical protein